MATTVSAYLTGFGSYLPGDSFSIDEIASRLGGDDAVTERIRCRVLEANGIRQRHTTRSTSTVSRPSCTPSSNTRAAERTHFPPRIRRPFRSGQVGSQALTERSPGVDTHCNWFAAAEPEDAVPFAAGMPVGSARIGSIVIHNERR